MPPRRSVPSDREIRRDSAREDRDSAREDHDSGREGRDSAREGRDSGREDHDSGREGRGSSGAEETGGVGPEEDKPGRPDSGHDRPGSGRGRPDSRHDEQGSGRVTAAQAAQAGLHSLVELIGKKPEGVTEVAPTEDGWRVGIEVVEDQRVPSSADILAIYEAELDPDGELLSYRRTSRYPRGRGDSPRES